MLTWSFAWTSSPARVAITSFAFMFELVPEPVWKTSIGNWSSNSPAAMRSPAAAMRCARSASRRPRSALARAAAALIRPSQCATETGIGSPETGKLATALAVSPPQSSSRSAVPLTAATLATVPPRPLQAPGVRAASSSSSQVQSFTRGRPRGSPAVRSAESIASQPEYRT